MRQKEVLVAVCVGLLILIATKNTDIDSYPRNVELTGNVQYRYPAGSECAAGTFKIEWCNDFYEHGWEVKQCINGRWEPYSVKSLGGPCFRVGKSIVNLPTPNIVNKQTLNWLLIGIGATRR